MSEEIRKTGIDIIGDAAWGTHFCQFYKTKKDLIDILIPYFKTGLENNEFCLWITSKPLIEKDAAKALRKVLPDLDSYLKKGQIEIIPHDKWYLKEGVFNSKRVLRGWLRKLDKALSKGYDGLRLTGNTFWLEKKDWRNFADYEKEVDSVIGKYKIIALCTYSLDKCKANEVIDVVQNHQFALIKREGRWEIVESSECKRTEDEIKRFASFPQLNPNPVLEVDSSGKIIFCNDAAIRTLRELNLGDANVFLPRDMTSILNALEQKKEVQFYREITVSDRIFGEVLHLAIQFNSVRIYANDITERKRYQEAMKNALAESRQREAEISALLEGSRAVLKYHDFKSAARSIFDSCEKLIGATSGYIALLSEDGTENEVLFLDSGGLPCTVDPGLPMPIRGLRGEAYNNVKTVYDNDFHRSEWMKFMPEGHVRLENVLFAPMVVEGKAVGLLGIANKPRGFTENDARMASAFAELAAIALTQKRAEEALNHSEEYFRLVTENASDVITILEADGAIRYESPSIEQVLGYKREDLIGKKVFEFVHPDDLPNAMNAFAQVIQNPGVSLSLELRCQHKDSSWCTLEIIGKNLLDNPAVGGIIINSRDITERKHAEQELCEKQEDLNRAQAVARTGSWRLDVRRNELLWSDENHRIFGIPKGTSMTYETFLGTVHPDDREYVDRKWTAALRGEHYDIEHRIVVQGNIKWVRERAMLEFDPQGTLLGGFGTTQDITERKKAEDEIRKLNLELENRVIKRTMQLRESKEQLQAILDNATAVIYLKDTEGRFIFINRQFEKLFNIKREEVAGKTDHELWPKEMADAFRKNDLDVLKAHAPLEIEEIAPHPDGIHTYISIKFPLFDSAGVPYGVCGISTDITARKMAEKIIKEQSDILDSLFKDTISPLVLLDRDFNFVRVNEAHARVCHRDINEFTGHNHFEFYPHEENEAIFREVVEAKFPFQAIAKPFVFPDHPEWGVTYWDWTLTPLLDANGEVKFLVFSLNDVTERKRAEDALKDSEERYRMLVETMNEGMGVDDENGFLIYANDRLCEMLGYSQDEIIGRPLLSFFDEKNQKIIKKQIERRKRGESEPYRLEWIKKDGQKIITLLSPRPIFDENGRYRGSFAVITNITEKLRLESIAEAVNTMNNIGYIFSGVRHEIGNPINSMKMALSILKNNLDTYPKEKVEEYLDRMMSEISRMEYSLKVMKNFNMYETLELMNVNMTTFMDKFLSLVADDFKKKGIKIETIIPETTYGYADPRALQQVLLNIITNASDALEGREDPTIRIIVVRMGGMVDIRVEDNGYGMSEDQQEDLFKPFYTNKAKGTGLGLVIAKKMMAKMNGVIEIVSQKDEGTIVDLFIPEGISEES
jgi:PAS domain S-box-containing protein